MKVKAAAFSGGITIASRTCARLASCSSRIIR